MDLANHLTKQNYKSLMLVSIGAGFILVTAMFAVIQLHKHVFETHNRAISITEQISGDFTASHLLLEETNAYNTLENHPLIEAKLNAISNQLAQLELAEKHTHIFMDHQQSGKFQQLHHESLALFQQLHEISLQRLSLPQASTTVDSHFNQVSDDFSEQLTRMRSILQHSYNQHIENLDQIQLGLIALAFIVLVLASRAVTLSLRKQQVYLSQAIASEAQTESILENALDAIITINQDDRIVNWNKKAVGIFGWRTNEVLGQPLAQFVIPERFRGKHISAIEKFVRTGKAGALIQARTETTGLRRNGQEFPVELALSHHLHNQQHYFTAFIRDITDQQQHDLALKNAEERLNEAQTIAKIGSWELDLTENKLSWSDEIYRIFEIDKSSFGASYDAFLEAIHPDDRKMVNEAYTNSLVTRKPYNIDHRLQMKDGRIKYVRESCESFFDEDGKAIRSIGTVQDISTQVENQLQRDAMNSEMEHMQRLESLGVLAGGIAHDFNNILSVIMTNSELASMVLNEASPALGHINHITRASEKASFLCKQMLAYSGKGSLNIEPIVLSALVEEMGQLLRTNIPENITLHTKLDRNLPAIEADTSQLIQLIMNLILNASEAIGSKPGTISIETGTIDIQAPEITEKFLKSKLMAGKHIYLKVSDTGEGMTEETLDHMFEPFFTTKFTGRGLGLSAALGIVRGHGGDIIVSSTPGKGSQLELYFPYGALGTNSADSPEIRSIPNPGEKCILIIDHPLVAKITASILKDSAVQPLFAANRKEARKIFEQHHDQISAVLLDVSRPEPGQESIFNDLCLIDPKARIFITSNYSESDASRQIPFITTNLAGFIQKPFAAEDLIAKIAKISGKT